MLEEDDGEFYLEFFSRSIILSLILALFMAPIVPGWLAGYLLIGVVGLGFLSNALFWWARGRILKVSKESSNSTLQAVASEEAETMFRVTGSTAIVLVLILAWLGYAKLLWVFESFFVLVAAIHIATSVIYSFLTLVAIREEIDDISTSIHGASTADNGDDTKQSD